MKKPMFLLPVGWNPTVRHINCWIHVSEHQHYVDELCQAIVVPCDRWDPVPRPASLQQVSAPGPPLFSLWKSLSRGGHAQCIQLIISSLLMGRGRALLHPFALPRHTSAWVQGKPPPDWEPWVDVHQAERGLLLLPASACCQGHPSSHQETSRHHPGQSSWGICTIHMWLRWLAVQLDKMGTWEEKQEGREVVDFAVDQATGLGHNWKEPASCLAWLQSTEQGILCPLLLAAPRLSPLHLLDQLHPCFLWPQVAWGGLDRILGKISLLKESSSIGTGCPGKWWSHHPWRGSINV